MGIENIRGLDKAIETNKKNTKTYKIIVKSSNQILKSDIPTQKEAQTIIKDYTENYDLYKKDELEIKLKQKCVKILNNGGVK